MSPKPHAAINGSLLEVAGSKMCNAGIDYGAMLGSKALGLSIWTRYKGQYDL